MELATSSFATSPDRPSLFELLAQDQLRGLLQPAVQYGMNVLAHSYPRYLIPLVNRHEEFYAVLMWAVERYHLKNHQASFSEHFYGLRRRRVLDVRTPRRDAFEGGVGVGPRTRLRKREIRMSLVQLVLIPYLRLKLHDLFLSLGGGVDASILPASSSSSDETDSSAASRRKRLIKRMERTFLWLYPWVNTAWEVVALGWNVRYLFERTDVWNLGGRVVHAGRVRVGRVTREDLEAASPSPFAPPPSWLASHLPSPPSILPFLLLSLKFLEFYHSPTSPFQLLSLSPSSSSGGTAKAHPPLPPPPRATPTTSGKKLLDAKVKEWGDCPVCGLKWRGATVGGSGGWVFCYQCIEKEVEKGEEVGGKGGRCPVSGMSIGREELRRVLI